MTFPQLAFFLSDQVSLGSPRKCTNVRTGLGPLLFEKVARVKVEHGGLKMIAA